MNIKDFIRPGRSVADITPVFLYGAVFRQVVDQLINLFKDKQIDKVVCIEGRGFIFGGAIAYQLGIGLVPIRQKGKLQNKVYSIDFIDYSNQQKNLEVHKDAISKGNKILIIDDWVETGNTMKTAINLVEQCGGEVIGVGVLVDDSSAEIKAFLKKYNYKYLEKVLPSDNF